jgi:hypothetical protein
MKIRQGRGRERRSGAGDVLSREAARLLWGLAEPGAYAAADPVEEGMLVLRRERAGVSLGGGRFSAKAVEELVRRDLVEPVENQRRPAFRLSGVGMARLKRQEAVGAADRGPEADLAFAAQHRDLVTERIEVEGRRSAVVLNACESPLEWLRRRTDAAGRPLIDAACHEAGERLRRDLTLAAMLPPVTASWDAAAVGKARGAPRDPAAATETAVAARQRVRYALEAVGTDLGDLLIDLCGFLKGLAQIERERGWPARSAKLAARLALARLAEHYGLSCEARGPARSRGLRSWHDAAEAQAA